MEMREQALEIKNAHPSVTGVWLEMKECEVEEMKDISKALGNQMNFRKDIKCLSLQVQGLLPNYGAEDGVHVTVFAYSKPVKIKSPVIEEYEYI